MPEPQAQQRPQEAFDEDSSAAIPATSFLGAIAAYLSDVKALITLQQRFILGTLSDRAASSQDNEAHLAFRLSCLNILSFYVFTGEAHVKALAVYGLKGEDPHVRAPFAPLKKMLGTPPVVTLTGQAGLKAHREFIPYTSTQQSVQSITAAVHRCFSEELSQVEQAGARDIVNVIRFASLRAIAGNIFGLVEIRPQCLELLHEIEVVLTQANPAFSPELRARLEAENQWLVEHNYENIMNTDNYLRSQLEHIGDESMSATDKLLSVNPIVGFLAVGNIAETIALATLMILSNPDIHANVLDAIAKDDDHYLKLVYYESLRFLSPSTITPRYTSKGTTVGNVKVPPRSYMFVNLYKIQHSPDNFDDPESFNPERQAYKSKEQGGREIRPGIYPLVPFFSGGRRCPAASMFAEAIFISALKTTFAGFELTPSDNELEVEVIDHQRPVAKLTEAYEVAVRTKPQARQKKVAAALHE